MSEHDPECTFEELKQEHLRALEAGDVEALQRVQKKLDELTGRESETMRSRTVLDDQELRAANRGLSGWLLVAAAAVTVLGGIGFMLS